MPPLEPARRRALRAKAHHLDPVVTIGHHGLTPAVLHEIDVALTAHELVKVRVSGDDRDARDDLLSRICAKLDCAPVQRIGKLLVLWRERPAEPPTVPTTPTRTPASSVTRRPPATAKAPRRVPRAPLPRRRRGI
ncbi:MAG TPA: YhbY family RNA-binding protein [Casimicrobiaceae bacterium]|jgi:putative YhbY family RNA-binding protein|nr:YhbY family RNA-binding protein [Casimicrobiaceae bacterium]